MIADVTSVPPEYLKWFVVCMGAFLVGAGAAVTFALKFRKQTREVRGGPVEVEGEVKVIPKGRRFSSEACDDKHKAIAEKLREHEGQIDKLWGTMRAEDEKTREQVNETFQAIQRSLGRIEGKLDSK